MSLKLNLFVKLKYESRTIILSVTVKFNMGDLFFDLNNYVSPANWGHAPHTAKDVSASAGISSH